MALVKGSPNDFGMIFSDLILVRQMRNWTELNRVKNFIFYMRLAPATLTIMSR